MNECCAYFCTGLSVFGLGGLLFMYAVLTNGGEWYLGISEHEAPAAASACLVAAAVYGVYLIYCGSKLSALVAAPKAKVGDEEE